MKLTKIINTAGKVGVALSIAGGIYLISDSCINKFSEANFVGLYGVGITAVASAMAINLSNPKSDKEKYSAN